MNGKYQNQEDMQRRMQEAKQLELIKKTIFFKSMTKEARERLNSVRIAHPELAAKAEIVVLQAVQSGQIKGMITDKLLKDILTELREKKDFRIKRG
jgi:DNA-binding TFAR19-related protein (PDSD5 family)